MPIHLRECIAVAAVSGVLREHAIVWIQLIRIFVKLLAEQYQVAVLLLCSL